MFPRESRGTDMRVAELQSAPSNFGTHESKAQHSGQCLIKGMIFTVALSKTVLYERSVFIFCVFACLFFTLTVWW